MFADRLACGLFGNTVKSSRSTLALMEDAERIRLNAADAEGGARVPWREWGPYLAERAWGTVREDYSEGGTAWDYFPHDHARSRAYRWNGIT